MQISVVIPAYNSGQFIEETLESVYAQTYLPHEVIVIDDGSIDDTQEKVLKFKDRSPKIIYIYQENKGQSTARNLGLRMATTDWVAFLDHDDIWHKNKLECQMNYIKNNPETVVLFSNTLFSCNGELLQNDYPINVSGIVENMFEYLLRGYIILPSTTVANKTKLLNYGGFYDTLHLAGDYYLWLRLALSNEVFAFQKEVLAIRQIHDSNLSKNRDAFIAEVKQILRRILLELPITDERYRYVELKYESLV